MISLFTGRTLVLDSELLVYLEQPRKVSEQQGDRVCQ